MSKYLLILFLFFMPFFFLGVELCYFFFYFSFHAFFSFLFGVALFFFFFRCWTFSFFFLGGAEFVLRVFGLFSLFLIFWALCFLSLSLDRLNKPLRNRFLLVLSRFSDRLRGTMVTQSKTISWTICKSSSTKYVYVPYSQLTVCAKWTYNVHNDRIYKEQESQKHVTTSCSGTNPFY